jgi:exopolyphosphatase / guanosine-5'-triphosphate,3'-diphosphate pyrophosphatase
MVAIIDLGSNTVRLNIYQIVNRSIQVVLSHKELASLSSYVNEFNQMTQAGIEKATMIVRHYVGILEKLNVNKKYMIVTAAIRNVTNSSAIMKDLKKVVPFSVELLSEEDEALADLEGVLIHHKFKSGFVIDIGGGSTEIVALSNDKVIYAKALKIGSLNAFSRHVDSLLPNKKELKRIELDVLDQLKKLELPPLKTSKFYGVGGTIRAARKLAITLLDLPTNTQELNYPQVKRLMELIQSKEKDVYLKIVQLVPERLHTILPGLQILKTLMRVHKKPLLIVHQQGVREGYLMKKLGFVQPKQVEQLARGKR